MSRFLGLFLTVGLIATGLVLTALAWYIYSSHHSTRQEIERSIRIDRLRSSIVHLDEVLTMSARMATATGNLEWERRYRRFEPLLATAIKEATRLVPLAASSAGATQTDAANLKLVEMENLAFEMVRQDRRQQAEVLLFGDAYKKQKLIYADGMKQLSDGLDAFMQANIHSWSREARWQSAAAFAVFFLIIIGWLIVFRIVNSWRVLLAQSNHRLQQQTTELAALNENLDQRVQQRTQALEASTAALQKEVTNHQRTETSLRQSEGRLAGILDLAQDGIISVDQSQRVILFNRGAEKLFGYTGQEVVGQSFTMLLPARSVQEDDQPDNFARCFGMQSDLYGLRKDGTEFAAEASLSTLEMDGACISTTIIRDVSARQLAQRKLAQQAEELARSNGELEQFAYVASHDLQEPLRKVQTFGDRLKTKCGDALSDQGRDYLERMQHAAGRMQSLIRDLLTFSRVTSKANPFVSLDLSTIAQEVISDLEIRIAQSGARVEVGALPTIDGDALQMRQLLQNLISNGLKFHRQDEPPVLTIRAAMVSAPDTNSAGYAIEDAWCQLTVSDNGIGFDEKYLDRIFAVFQRLHGRNDYDGTGVGLAICRKIAERHSGRITAQSKPGEGATFIVTLPVTQTKEKRADV